jgi:phosphohistidine phosphatase SixA
MRKEHVGLRRRPFLAPVWIGALLGAIALAIAAWVVVEASTTIVVVTRHAEKGADDPKDPSLAPEGVARAERLASIFGGVRDGQAIDAIFVTQWKRTGQTARPLATRLGVPVIILPADDVDGLRHRIFDEYRGKRVLVVAHSNTVTEIVGALADGGEYPPIADDEYGTSYVVAVPRWSRTPAPRKGGAAPRSVIVAEHEVDLEHAIAGFVHAKVCVDRLRGRVLVLDVQPQPADVRVRMREVAHVAEQRREHALVARLRHDVHGLDPPEPAAAPVAPLVRDHQLSDGPVAVVHDVVPTALRVREHRSDAFAEQVAIEFALLRLPGEARVPVHDELEIGGAGRADDERHAVTGR